jgi:hypothetical protein
MNTEEHFKYLLPCAFEAGRDYEYAEQFQRPNSKPNFERFYEKLQFDSSGLGYSYGHIANKLLLGNNWVISNETRPKIEGYYNTINSIGQEQYTEFRSGHWQIDFNNGQRPVVKWLANERVTCNCISCGTEVKGQSLCDVCNARGLDAYES